MHKNSFRNALNKNLYDFASSGGILLKLRDLYKGNCCFIKSKFEYVNTINIYLLISAKKQIFAYFQYLICLNKILQTLNFCIPYRGKKKVGEK